VRSAGPATRAAVSSALNVGARARDIRALHYDVDRPGRPFSLILGGAAVTIVSLFVLGFVAYHTFYAHTVSQNSGIFWLGLAFFPYAGGVFLFCYGYELCDAARALRLTLIVLVVSAAALVAFAVVLGVLSKSKGAAAAVSESSGHSGSAVGGGLPHAIFSVVDDYAGGSRAAADEAPSDLFAITCERCHHQYMPVPPKAVCPSCGWAAVTVA